MDAYDIDFRLKKPRGLSQWVALGAQSFSQSAAIAAGVAQVNLPKPLAGQVRKWLFLSIEETAGVAAAGDTFEFWWQASATPPTGNDLRLWFYTNDVAGGQIPIIGAIRWRFAESVQLLGLTPVWVTWEDQFFARMGFAVPAAQTIQVRGRFIDAYV